MNHRSKGKKLNRSKKHRGSLLKNLSMNLFEHGSINTTEAKAKALRGYAEKLITQAKKGTVPARRKIAQVTGKRKPANHLIDVVVPKLSKRSSGYIKITRTGQRKGDDAMMVRVDLIDYQKEIVSPKKETTKKPKKASKKETKKTDDSAKKSKTTKKEK
ncbi:50S ribosomal protein L17 [Patescibacteria group bacterium]